MSSSATMESVQKEEYQQQLQREQQQDDAKEQKREEQGQPQHEQGENQEQDGAENSYEDKEDEMRLRKPSQSFSGTANGSNAEIVDKLLGTAERKRARPTSSLDIKVADGDKLAHSPNKVSPKPKYQLSDLDGMSEEELLQALYDDPELAATAAAAAEKLKKQKSSAGNSKKRSKRSSSSYGSRVPPRGSSSSSSGHDSTTKKVNDHPAHLQAMMKDGVPVTQWVFVLLLVGVCVYQLRKVLTPPATNRPASGANSGGKAKTKTKRALKQLRGAKKPINKPRQVRSVSPAQSNGINNNKKKTAVSVDEKKKKQPQPKEKQQKPVTPPKAPEKITASTSTTTESSSPSKKKRSNNNRKKKVATKKAVVNAPVATTETSTSGGVSAKGKVPQDHPDGVSTDGSSSTDGVDQMALSNTDDDLAFATALAAEDGPVPQENEWMTVGSKGKNGKPVNENGTPMVTSVSPPDSPVKRQLPVSVNKPPVPVKEEAVEEEKKADEEAESNVVETKDKTKTTPQEKASNNEDEGEGQSSSAADKTVATPVVETKDKVDTTTQEKASNDDNEKKEGEEGQSSSPEQDSSSADKTIATTNEPKTAADPKVVPPVATVTTDEKTGKDANTPASSTSETADDEALAKLLQQEEERLSKPIANKLQEGAWAEVPMKRGKKKQQT